MLPCNVILFVKAVTLFSNKFNTTSFKSLVFVEITSCEIFLFSLFVLSFKIFNFVSKHLSNAGLLE